jgi:hypothetical protein
LQKDLLQSAHFSTLPGFARQLVSISAFYFLKCRLSRSPAGLDHFPVAFPRNP